MAARVSSAGGTPLVDWVVMSLDANRFEYYEGGDAFVLEREECPAP